MLFLALLVTTATLSCLATSEEEEWTCPAAFSVRKLYSDQAEYEAAPAITVPPPYPMKQELWWALTTYEHYYTYEWEMKQYVPHLDTRSVTLTPQFFQDEFRRHGQPVIIPFKSLRKLGFKTRSWTLNELLERFPLPNANASAHDFTELLYSANFVVTRDDIDFAPALHAIARNTQLVKSKEGKRNYPRNSFFTSTRVLAKLGIYGPPQLLINSTADALKQSSLWFGTNTSHTPLHHDGNDNFICQLMGSKEFYVFPPTDWRVLDPKCDERQKGLCHATRVRNTFEYIAEVLPHESNPIRFVLHAGEMLYLPAGWFHSVRNLGPTLMVNYWTETPREYVGLVKTMMDEDAYN